MTLPNGVNLLSARLSENQNLAFCEAFQNVPALSGSSLSSSPPCTPCANLSTECLHLAPHVPICKRLLRKALRLVFAPYCSSQVVRTFCALTGGTNLQATTPTVFLCTGPHTRPSSKRRQGAILWRSKKKKAVEALFTLAELVAALEQVNVRRAPAKME